MNQLVEQIKGMTSDLKALNDRPLRHDAETLNAVAEYVKKANPFQLWYVLNAMVDPVASYLGDAQNIEYARDDIAEQITQDEQEEDELCGNCNGSGEGMYEGTRCYVCKGSGCAPKESDDD